MKKKIGFLLIFLLMPASVFLMRRLFGEGHDVITSAVLLAETMVPFLLSYESRRPRAREIVMIAVLSALTVIGNLLSFSFLPIQAGTAMVILSGIAFGPEAGFLIGALVRFTVNFFQGQGAWTPWQMFCWGLLGFLAGLCFHKYEKGEMNSRRFRVMMGPILCVIFCEIAAWILYLLFPMGESTFLGWRLYAAGAVGLILGAVFQRSRLPADRVTVCVFSFAAVFIIYGGIMNICTQLVSAAVPGGTDLSAAGLKALYVSGVPYDFWHALRTSFFILLFGDGILKRLERVKVKYGFYRI